MFYYESKGETFSSCSKKQIIHANSLLLGLVNANTSSGVMDMLLPIFEIQWFYGVVMIYHYQFQCAFESLNLPHKKKGYGTMFHNIDYIPITNSHAILEIHFTGLILNPT